MNIVLTILLYACSYSSNIKNPSGRDTITQFGDGSYEIGRTQTMKPLTYLYGGSIIPNVVQFREISDINKVYVIGNDVGSQERENGIIQWNYTVYGVIDTMNNTIQICAVDEIGSDRDYWFYSGPAERDNAVQELETFEEFSAEDRAIFADMKEKGDGLIDDFVAQR